MPDFHACPSPAGRRRALSVLAAGAFLALRPAWAGDAPVQIGGVSFDPLVQLAGQNLQLNGVGLRAVAWIKGYAAGLYLGQRSDNTERIVGQAGPKRLQLRMLLDVPVAEFIKAFHVGVERNTPAEAQPRLAERMARFDALIRPLGDVRKGDRIDLDFLPGQGLLFSVNGKTQGAAIPGEDLYGALLLCFIGDRPVDKKLKAGLLGQKA